MAAKKLTASVKKIPFPIHLPLLWIGAACLMIHMRTLRSSLMIDLISLALLVCHTRAMGWVPFTFLDCLSLFPLLLAEQILFSLDLIAYSFEPLVCFFFLIDLCLILLCRRETLQTHALGISLTGITGYLLLLGKRLLNKRLIRYYYAAARLFGWTPVQKIFAYTAAALFYFLLFAAGIRLIGLFLGRWDTFFRRFRQRCQGIEIYVLLMTAIILIVIMVIPYSSFMVFHWYNLSFPVPTGLFWLIFFLLFISAIYLCLLIKTVLIRRNMQVLQSEKETLASYSRDLETNLERMKEIRHDTKNLFLTMAGFVERSGDPEMAAFYHRHITPFLQEALDKNELMDQLKLLEDDQLKSFLYYKLIRQKEARIPLRLSVSSSVRLDVGYGDLIRLLGILLDNAAEEAAKACGPVSVDIAEDAAGIRFRIENAVCPQTRAQGVIPGHSDKGPGRGSGLLIARKIVRKYGNLRLNSYFTDSGFVQLLLIARDRR